MSVRVALVLAALALAVVPPSAGQEAAPSVTIVSPGPNLLLQTSVLQVQVEVAGFRLVPPQLSAGDATDHGHLRVTVDGRDVRGLHEDGSRTAETKVLVTGLEPGNRTVRVELVRPDGEPLSPRVFDEVAVTVAQNAPFVEFREGEPWPGVRYGDSVHAEVRTARPPSQLPVDRVEVQWSLDGSVVKTGPETEYEYTNLVAGVHRLRAEMILNGQPLQPRVYDEVLVGVPSLEFKDGVPGTTTAGKDFAPARVPYALELKGATFTDHEVRVMVDHETVATSKSLQGEVEVPIGAHVVAVELVGLSGASLVPPVGDAFVVDVSPPPPGVRIVSPPDYGTVTSRFAAAAEVSNFTVVEPGAGVGDPTQGHVVWYLDGRKIEEGTDLNPRLDNLSLGLHELEVRLVASDGTDLGVNDTAPFNVDVNPQEAVDGDDAGANVKESPAPAPVLLVGAAAAAATARRFTKR